MKVTGEFARYVLGLQQIAKMETGGSDQDLLYREQLERAYPILRSERLNAEFERWLQECVILADVRLFKLRLLLERETTHPPKGRCTDFDYDQWRAKCDRIMATYDELRATIEAETRKRLEVYRSHWKELQVVQAKLDKARAKLEEDTSNAEEE